MSLRFDNKVALITGAGRGLGREYALLLARRGAKVIVNDLGGTYDGTTATTTGIQEQVRVADAVVNEIRSKGGEATANYDSAVNGERVVQACIDAYGRLDIVVANAGILTPETFQELGLKAFERTLRINVTGVFSTVQAAWPHLLRNKYGRIVMISSPALFGAGVPAYAASKAALIGLSNSMQFEANKLRPRGSHDIKCNAIIPFAQTRMTDEFAKDVARNKRKQGKKLKKTGGTAGGEGARMTQMMHPGNVAAMVAWLCHESCTNEGTIHEAGAGYFTQIRFERSVPLFASINEGVVEGFPTPEHVRDGQATLNTFTGEVVATGDGSMGGNPIMRAMKHINESSSSSSSSSSKL